MKHKHAKYIIAWANGVEVQFSIEETLDQWADVGESHYWNPDWQYRFKPKMIKVGEHEFPEPMRVAPSIGTEYWVVCSTARPKPFHNWVWGESTLDFVSLGRGFCHATKEAAEAHARALIALTEVQP